MRATATTKVNTSQRDQTPGPLRPFTCLGFDIAGFSGEEAFGTCIFCGKRDKMYVNSDTGQYSCKSGHCMKEGNVYTLLEEYYGMHVANQDRGPWSELLLSRGLPEEVLKGAGLCWDGSQWLLPARNIDGKIVTLLRYQVGGRLRGIPTLPAALLGAHKLVKGDRRKVYICEGQWDEMALQYMFDRDGADRIALAVPGAGVFKGEWAQWLMNRELVGVYDRDSDGLNGTRRMVNLCKPMGCQIEWVVWPEETPEGYDSRDFLVNGGTTELLDQITQDWADPDAPQKKRGVRVKGSSKAHNNGQTDTQPSQEARRLDDPSRPTMEAVIEAYKKWLYMTPDMVDMLRIMYAVVMSQFIDGDPLWVHLAGPPGSGKTALLLSLKGLSRTHFASTLTPHSLVSGFQSSGGGDPSLIPLLDGKTFVLKDFTEVLEMPPVIKAEVYSILRGAFDGEVTKRFGNGVLREYNSHFNMVTGVTQNIFADVGASLGQRFLRYHVIKGVDFVSDDAIMAAIMNSGKGDEMREALGAVASSFLEVDVLTEELPEMTMEFAPRVTALSQLVSMLRADVVKDAKTNSMTHRPQYEIGTRLGLQFTKLLKGLALCRIPASITEDDYRLVARVAMDTTVGFNLDVVRALWEKDGMTSQELAEVCNIPSTTLSERLRDMAHLGILKRERSGLRSGAVGQPPVMYTLSDLIRRHWTGACLDQDNLYKEALRSSEERQPQRMPGARRYRVKRVRVVDPEEE